MDGWNGDDRGEGVAGPAPGRHRWAAVGAFHGWTPPSQTRRRGDRKTACWRALPLRSANGRRLTAVGLLGGRTAAKTTARGARPRGGLRGEAEATGGWAWSRPSSDASAPGRWE